LSNDVLKDFLVSFSLFMYGLILILLLGILDPIIEMIFLRLF